MLDGNRFEGGDSPDVTERYEAAGNTSDMTIAGGMVRSGHKGQGDIIAAAGMVSDSRLGMDLLRLHSAWQSCSKPKRLNAGQIKRLSLTILDSRGRPDHRQAAKTAAGWYANELRLLATGLRGRAAVIDGLTAWAAIKGIAPCLVSEAVLHWLDGICKECHGHGFYAAEGSPALSAKRCQCCHGTGETPRPEGTTRVLNHIDYALECARNSLKKRLRP